jgi:hypothetical protein
VFCNVVLLQLGWRGSAFFPPRPDFNRSFPYLSLRSWQHCPWEFPLTDPMGAAGRDGALMTVAVRGLELARVLRYGYLSILLVWVGTYACCALAVIYFYGLLGAGVIYPFANHLEQGFAVLRTALIATLASSWTLWFGARRKDWLLTTLLKIGVTTQITLTIYAIIGWRSPSSLNLIFPSTFFAEYNWLIFIFEIAPITSVASTLLLYVSLVQKPLSDL